MTTLSKREQELLQLLREDARKSVTDLAKELGVSRPTLQNMMKKLEEVAISRYTVELKPTFANAPIRAYVLLNREPRKSNEILDVIMKFPTVRYVCTITGEFDVIVELEAGQYEDLEAILHGIELIDGVVRTQTYMVLSENFSQKDLPFLPANLVESAGR
jgi:DNA-binding Lrp family transcriptional regulator